jgi:hypothetical protein
MKSFCRESTGENIPDNVYETEKYLLKTNSYIREDRKMPAISSYKEICSHAIINTIKCSINSKKTLLPPYYSTRIG